MARFDSNGYSRRPTNRQEILAFGRLRDIGGMTVEAAAKSLNRSRTWGYLREADRRTAELVPPAGVGRRRFEGPPTEAQAVGLMLLMVQEPGVASEDEDNPPTKDDFKRSFLRMLNEHGVEIVFPLARVALYLAHLRAEDLQREYGDQLEEPITVTDVLETITSVFDVINAGEEEAIEVSSGLPPELDSYWREWIEEMKTA